MAGEATRVEVRVVIERFVDDYQPGWVECTLRDADGRVFVFREKAPIVSDADLTRASSYPQPGSLACMLVGRRRGADGEELVVIDTEEPYSIAAITGETRFEVPASALVADRAAET